MKSNYGKFNPEFFMCEPLILDKLIIMSSLAYPPRYSSKEANLRTLIEEYSYFNKKLTSLDKISILQ